MKYLISSLCLVLLTTACSKQGKNESHPKDGNAYKERLAPEVVEIEKLFASQAPNIALAEFLLKTLPENVKKDARDVLVSLTVQEAEDLLRQFQKQNLGIKQNYLFHGQKYKTNTYLLNNTLLDPKDVKVESGTLGDELRFALFAHIKHKALNEIISTYDQRANDLAQELAGQIAYEIAQNPSESAEIEKIFNGVDRERAVQLISKTSGILKAVDKYFKSSNLNSSEQYTLLTAGVIAGGIYHKLTEYKSFQRILKEGKKIYSDFKDIQKKAKEFVLLTRTLEEHISSTAKNMKNLREGIQGTGNDLTTAFKEAQNRPNDINSKRIMNFLYEKVIKGKDVDENGENESVLSHQRKVNENFQKVINSAGELTNNLSTIINTTNNIAKLLGIRPSKDVQKVLDKVNKVGQVISVAQAAITGWTTAGPMGALAALGSGPMSSLLGAGGGSSAKLDEISRKLDIVIENQKRIMEMQLETMKMVKELALMVDSYHQKEMMALAELRDISLVNLELEKAKLNENIRNCEWIINFQLSSVWKDFNFAQNSFYSIGQADLMRTQFQSGIKGLDDVRRVVSSLGGNVFANCQLGIAEAFGGSNHSENPIRGIFTSNETDNLYRFQRETYRPLLKALEQFTDNSSFDPIPLHLPIKNAEALDKAKAPYVEYAKYAGNGNNEVYDMEELLSTRNLERYLTVLLILQPVLELDKDVWMGDYKKIIHTYLMNSSVNGNQNIRSHFFLTNALKLVQTSIAQEALLAGEPLLVKMRKKYFESILSSKTCYETETPADTYYIPFICSVRQNGPLMKNFIIYSLNLAHRNDPNFIHSYEEAYKSGNALQMLQILHLNGVNAPKLVKDGENFTMELTLTNQKVRSVVLPSVEAIKKGEFIYSENMPRLLQMQELILKGLEKVTPVKREAKTMKLLFSLI